MEAPPNDENKNWFK